MERSSTAGTQSDTSSGTITASESLPKGSGTASCQKPRSSAMSEHSSVKGTPKHIREWLMSSQPVSLASRSVSPGSKPGKTTPGICGLEQLSAFAWYDRNLSYWRTYQPSLISTISDKFSETWPRQGLMQAGVCWALTIVEPTIGENDSGFWPTPRAEQSTTISYGKETSWAMAKRLYGGDRVCLCQEWLMGWPIGWTDLKPLATDRFRQWLGQFGVY